MTFALSPYYITDLAFDAKTRPARDCIPTITTVLTDLFLSSKEVTSFLCVGSNPSKMTKFLDQCEKIETFLKTFAARPKILHETVSVLRRRLYKGCHPYVTRHRYVVQVYLASKVKPLITH